jgi:hypothetical protein
MTFRTDPEFDEDEMNDGGLHPAWAGAAGAVSVLIIATITLTLVASGLSLSIVPFG